MQESQGKSQDGDRPLFSTILFQSPNRLNYRSITTSLKPNENRIACVCVPTNSLCLQSVAVSLDPNKRENGIFWVTHWGWKEGVKWNSKISSPVIRAAYSRSRPNEHQLVIFDEESSAVGQQYHFPCSFRCCVNFGYVQRIPS